MRRHATSQSLMSPSNWSSNSAGTVAAFGTAMEAPRREVADRAVEDRVSVQDDLAGLQGPVPLNGPAFGLGMTRTRMHRPWHSLSYATRHADGIDPGRIIQPAARRRMSAGRTGGIGLRHEKIHLF